MARRRRRKCCDPHQIFETRPAPSVVAAGEHPIQGDFLAEARRTRAMKGAVSFGSGEWKMMTESVSSPTIVGSFLMLLLFLPPFHARRQNRNFPRHILGHSRHIRRPCHHQRTPPLQCTITRRVCCSCHRNADLEPPQAAGRATITLYSRVMVLLRIGRWTALCRTAALSSRSRIHVVVVAGCATTLTVADL